MCNSTQGAPKTFLRQLQEAVEAGGFLALKLLQAKQDIFAKSSTLREFLEVIVRARINNKGSLETEVENWEAKIAKLESRYNQPNFLSEEVKAAIYSKKAGTFPCQNGNSLAHL